MCYTSSYTIGGTKWTVNCNISEHKGSRIIVATKFFVKYYNKDVKECVAF